MQASPLSPHLKDLSARLAQGKEQECLYQDEYKRLVKMSHEQLTFVCKCIDLCQLHSLEIDFSLFLEVQEHSVKFNRKYCQHPNILSFYDYFKDENALYYYYEHCAQGSLKGFSVQNEGQLFPLFFQVCLGLDHLHKNHVVHNSLKSSNVLIDQFSNAKIKGFKKSVLTQDYSLFLPDFQGLAIMLYQKATGFKFTGQHKMMMHSLSPQLQLLISSLFQAHPEDSPQATMAKVFSSQWFAIQSRLFDLTYLRDPQFAINQDHIALLLKHQNTKKSIFGEQSQEAQEPEMFKIISSINQEQGGQRTHQSAHLPIQERMQTSQQQPYSTVQPPRKKKKEQSFQTPVSSVSYARPPF